MWISDAVVSVCLSVVTLDHRPPPPFFSPARAQGVRGRASQLDEREGMGRRGHTPRSCRGIVSFEEVHFAFPTRAQLPVLRGVSFTVREGEVCAIVGPSGGEARREGGPVRGGAGLREHSINRPACLPAPGSAGRPAAVADPPFWLPPRAPTVDTVWRCVALPVC